MSFECHTGTPLFVASISNSNAAFLDGSTVPLAEYASAATTLPPFSGFRYWVTFIDDYSRYQFILPIKAKSDVFEAFKQFKAYAENQSKRKIKILRDDKGGE